MGNQQIALSVMKKLEQIGPTLTIEAEYSYGTDGPDILCKDVDTRIHVSYGVEFIKLLKGLVTTDAKTSKGVWPKDVPY